MSPIGHRKFHAYWYSSKDLEEGTYIMDDNRLVVIKVKEGWRISYYHRNNDSGDYELIPDEDNGFERATALPKSEAEAIKLHLKVKHPDAEVSHIEKL